MNLSKKHNKHIAHMLHVAWFGQNKTQSLKAWLVDENAIYYNLCEMYSNAKCHRRPTIEKLLGREQFIHPNAKKCKLFKEGMT